VRDLGRDRQAPLYLLGRDFDFADEGQGSWRWQGLQPPIAGVFSGLRCALKGAYQQQNGSVAVAAALLLRNFGFQIDAPAIAEGLASVFWPGRMEYLQGGGPADAADRTGIDLLDRPITRWPKTWRSPQADFAAGDWSVSGCHGRQGFSGPSLMPRGRELILISRPASAPPARINSGPPAARRGKALCAPIARRWPRPA
jgi:hypothetical protein